MNSLNQLLEGKTLSQQDSKGFFQRLVKGELNDTQISAALVAMKMRGETPAELAGAAEAVLDVCKPFNRPDQVVVDSCGTGGDGSNTINISTTAALVSASMGLCVAKHGNRSVSSRSGSADVLESLKLRTNLDPRDAATQLAENHFCFLFAPHYHPGIKYAMPVRQTLKTRTLFNLIGPLVNPARPDAQLLGVYSPEWVKPMAETLQRLGVKRAMVVHGSGLDELALHGPSQVAELNNGELTEYRLTPADFGLNEAPLSELKGGDADCNARALQQVLRGKASSAQTQAVAMNVAAIVYLAGQHSDLKSATEAALAHIHSGVASEHLERVQQAQETYHV
ncbi:MAG: anthranilate phosphoribosyltransferase [Idiomarina sp.]|nr:anthranilate phosphoribosyltransferase [Idiomarina sp.]PHQ77331.1 MAG: anthranilate phosphoribosyltransferase [Idiomarina sp.]